MNTPHTFRLYIDVNNDAFEPEPYAEVARLLREIADRVESVVPHHTKHSDLGDYPDRGWSGHYQTIHDVNGNDVGRYAFKPTSEKS